MIDDICIKGYSHEIIAGSISLTKCFTIQFNYIEVEFFTNTILLIIFPSMYQLLLIILLEFLYCERQFDRKKEERFLFNYRN